MGNELFRQLDGQRPSKQREAESKGVEPKRKKLPRMAWVAIAAAGIVAIVAASSLSLAPARPTALDEREIISPAEYERRLESYRDSRRQTSTVEAEETLRTLKDELLVEVVGEVRDVKRHVEMIPPPLMEPGEVVVVFGLQGPEQSRAMYPYWRETAYVLVSEQRASEFRSGERWRIGIMMEEGRFQFGTHCYSVHETAQQELASILQREIEHRAKHRIDPLTDQEEAKIIQELYPRLVAAERVKPHIIHPARDGMHIRLLGRAE